MDRFVGGGWFLGGFFSVGISRTRSNMSIAFPHFQIVLSVPKVIAKYQKRDILNGLIWFYWAAKAHQDFMTILNFEGSSDRRLCVCDKEDSVDQLGNDFLLELHQVQQKLDDEVNGNPLHGGDVLDAIRADTMIEFGYFVHYHGADLRTNVFVVNVSRMLWETLEVGS